MVRQRDDRYSPMLDAWRRARTIRWAVSALIAVAAGGALSFAREQTPDPSAILQRQTQELVDAIARGDRAPWTRYLDDSMFYAAEDGTVKTKTELIEELRPFPKEIWGRIHIRQFRSVRHGSAAVTNYIIDEEEGSDKSSGRST